MLEKILPLLNRLIPAGIAFKGLQRLDPRIGKFLTGAVAGGYSADQALDYLRNKFQDGNSEQALQGQRPDQQAAYQQVQNSKQLPKALANATGIAAGGVAPMVLGSLFGDDNKAIRGEVQMSPGEEEQNQIGYQQQKQIGYQQPQTQTQPSQPQPQPSQSQPGQQSPQGPNLSANILPTDILKKYQGFTNKIDELRRSGNDLVSIAGYFHHFNPSQVKKIEKESGVSLEELIDAYLTQNQIQIQQSPQQSKSALQQGQNSQAKDQLLQAMQAFSQSLKG